MQAFSTLKQITTAALVLFITLGARAQMTFTHPGGLNNQPDLDYVKTQIDNGAQPWTGAFNSMLGFATATNNNTAPTSEGGQKQDGQKAYANALAWHYTGNTTYAENAIGILNMWATTFNGYGSTTGQDLLQGAWIGSLLAPAAELMRDYQGWSANEISTLQQMFVDEFYPVINTMSTWNGNVDLTQIEAIMGMAVFNEDEDEFNLGLSRMAARFPAYFYLASDGGVPAIGGDGGNVQTFWSSPTDWVDGLTQESCRDNGHHSQFAMAAALHAAEVAWNQGVDVYAEHEDRFVASLELMAVQMITGSMQGTCANNTTDGGRYNTWEVGYNHYHNRMGINMPNTGEIIVDQIRSNGASDWNIFYETLTHANEEQSQCDTPDLGANQSLCGVSSIILDAQLATNGRTFSWWLNGDQINGASNTLTVSEAGEYTVISDESGCVKQDKITIIASLPAVSLGGDVQLCNPAIADLTVDLTGEAISYAWEKDGALIAGQSDQTLVVDEAGDYQVIVSAAGCADQTDEVTVTSALLTGTGSTICKAGEANLVAAGGSGTYEWFATQESNDVLYTGASIYADVDETTTFYVKDAGGMSSNIGKAEQTGAELWNLETTDYLTADKQLSVIVEQSLTISSIAVYVTTGGIDVTLRIMNGNTEVASYTASGVGAGKQVLNVGFELDPGSYTLDAVGTTGQLQFEAGDPAFPHQIADYISIANIESWAAAWNGQFYDITVQVGNTCVGTPVTATVDPEGDCLVTVGSDLSAAKWSIYPNPFQSHFLLQTELELTYRVLDVRGLVYKVGTVQGSIELGNDLPNGMYIVQLQQGLDTRSIQLIKTN